MVPVRALGVIRTIVSNKAANLKLTLYIYIHDFLDINREVGDWVGGCEDYDLDDSGMSEETVLKRQPAVGRRFHSARCTGERSGRGKKLTNQSWQTGDTLYRHGGRVPQASRETRTRIIMAG